MGNENYKRGNPVEFSIQRFKTTNVRNLEKTFLNLPLFQMALSSKVDLQLDNRTRIISSRNMTATQRRIN